MKVGAKRSDTEAAAFRPRPTAQQQTGGGQWLSRHLLGLEAAVPLPQNSASPSACCMLPGGAPAPHLQSTEAAMQIVQSRGKDELLIGTTQDLERQDSQPDI